MRRAVRLIAAAFWLVTWQECHWSDMGGGCETKVQRFDDRQALVDFLSARYSPNTVGGEAHVYEVEKEIFYDVNVTTKEVERKSVETVETGRAVKFK